ncbi:hypothetical protein CEXT_279251 [Caerostris extrusa]|uniref:Uncharacterized protein n=1 Tax=Caerostris extrusa TaxID=172846 RepID=A0AAV4SUW3_CAEEX|nr:hypothetical protein CEXT_279251 [Caerostris extrusa]
MIRDRRTLSFIKKTAFLEGHHWKANSKVDRGLSSLKPSSIALDSLRGKIGLPSLPQLIICRYPPSRKQLCPWDNTVRSSQMSLEGYLPSNQIKSFWTAYRRSNEISLIQTINNLVRLLVKSGLLL